MFNRSPGFCASTKTRIDIAPVRRIEVAPGISQQPGTCCETTATQYFMRAKPRLRVFLVGVDYKSWIGMKRVGCPFPHIAQHLPATMRAIAMR